MPISSYYGPDPANQQERAYLESLIREDFERCHPGDTLEHLKRRASFSREDRGLLGDWMAIAARAAAAKRSNGTGIATAA
jgi:hypothetical protein